MSKHKPRPEPWWRGHQTALVVGGLAAVTIITYAAVLGADFTNYKDNAYVTNNRAIRAGVTWRGFSYAFDRQSVWHPLTWISHMIDCQIFGPRPWGHHLTSLILHVAGVLGLFAVLRLMTGSVWRSGLVAALYSLHPLHVESVAWVAERKGILSSALWVLTLWAYAAYCREGGGRRAALAYGGVVLGTAAVLAAKPNWFTLPLSLLLLDYWPLERMGSARHSAHGGFRRRALGFLFVEKLPLMAVVAWLGIRPGDVPRELGVLDEFPGLTWYGRVANTLVSTVWYLGKAIWPARLACFYPRAGDDIPLWKPAAAAALIVVITLVALAQARRRPYLAVGWLWYLVNLLPTSDLLRIGAHGMADRYGDIPLIGIWLIVAWGLGEWVARVPARVPLASGVAIVTLTVLALASSRQTLYWRDAVVLFQHALDVTDDNKLAHANYAFMLQDRLRRPAEALYHFRRVVELDPTDGVSHDMLGVCLIEQGREPEAFAEFEAATRLSPDHAQAHVNLAVAQTRRGRYEEARRHFTRAIELDDKLALARREYGLFLIAQGDWPGAIEELTRAITLDPDDPLAPKYLARATGMRDAARPTPTADPPPSPGRPP